jgi:hypothetical protein
VMMASEKEKLRPFELLLLIRRHQCDRADELIKKIQSIILASTYSLLVFKGKIYISIDTEL